MKKLLVLLATLAVAVVILDIFLIVSRHTQFNIKRLIANLRTERSAEKTPSVFKKIDRKKLYEYHPVYYIREHLGPNQILLEEVMGMPEGAPRGAYVKVTLVLETPDKKAKEYIRSALHRVEAIISETLGKISYEELSGKTGMELLKKSILKQLSMVYGKKIKDLYLVEVTVEKARREVW